VIASLIRLARPGQWLKNGVVFAGLIFAGELANRAKVELAILAAVAFCLISSAVYVINDIADREKDRRHPLKKERPIASGRITVTTGFGFAVLLLVAGIFAAWVVNGTLVLVCCSYLILNVMYTFWLKHMVILDVMAIAGGFILRAYAGAVAVDVPASNWLMINTLMLALFLGFGKRRHELVLLEGKATDHRKSLSKYSPYLLDQLIGVVTASVVVIYMLYTFSPEVSEKLGTGNLFITIPFVVYGVFRYLYLIHKEERGGSPTRVLVSDRPLLFTVLLWLATVVLVMYLA